MDSPLLRPASAGLADRAGEEAACRALAARDPLMARCMEAGPLDPPVLRPAGFPGLVRLILEQQVSVAAADAMWRRLTDCIGLPVPDTLLALEADELRQCGFSRPKMSYARNLAEVVRDGLLDLDAVHRLDDEAAIAALVTLKGIGRWSAECYLMLALGRPDLWPVDDLALIIGMQRLLGRDERPSRSELLAMAEPWRPYRSTAARLVWRHYRLTRGRPPAGR